MKTVFRNRATANRYFRRYFPAAQAECRKSGVHAGITFIRPCGHVDSPRYMVAPILLTNDQPVKLVRI